MKFPNNIILDINSPSISLSSQYWIYRYLTNFQKDFFNCKTFLDYRFLIYRKENLLLNKLTINANKYTLTYKNSNQDYSSFSLNKITNEKKNIFAKIYKTRFKIKNRNVFMNVPYKDNFEHTLNKNLFNNKKIKKFFFVFKKHTNSLPNNLFDVFNINFLRKEKIYTKLKYSRVPQYDIVSGGVAAVFAGFLGFLVCEKFGFELLDSGDFYFLFMYVVFISFFSRLYVKLFNKFNSEWNIFSLKWLLSFYKNLIILMFRLFTSKKY